MNIYKFLGILFSVVGLGLVWLGLTAPRNKTYHNCQTFLRTHPDNLWVSIGENTVVITDNNIKVLELGLESKIHASYENGDEISYLPENPEIHYLAENKYLFTISKSKDTCIQLLKTL